MPAFTRRHLLAGAASQFALASRPSRAASDAIAPNLTRGVNLSHWFAQSLEPNTRAHFVDFVGAERLTQLARRGFDHVRVPIDPDVLFEAGADSFRADIVDHLARAVSQVQSSGLAVVLDLHPVGAQKNALLEREGAATFVRRWRRLARAVDATNARVYLEVLNEPWPLKGDAWWELQGAAIAAIRETLPHTILIANGGAWSNVEDLVAHKPYADRRIVYTVHYYAPILFTQQGIPWGWPVLGQVKALGWPLAPGDAAQATQAATKDPDATRDLRDAIQQGTFTRAHMEAAFADLRRWQTEHGNPSIYIGEFGVVAQDAPQESRLRWIETARTTFEAYGWGWALWDLSPSFGLLDVPSTWTPWRRMSLDAPTMSALGLDARGL